MGQIRVKFQDSDLRESFREYEAPDNLTVAEQQDLVQKVQDISALSVVGAKYTIDVDVSGITDPVEAGATVKKNAFLIAEKTDGDKYSFNLTQPKAALMSGTDIVITSAAILAFSGLFDDGGGNDASTGLFTLSDGEQLKEKASVGNGAILIKGGLS